MVFLKAFLRPHIALLWVSQVLSAMGDYFYTIAVIWLAVRTVGSNAGFIVAAGTMSQLLFGLIGGVYADRWDRRKIMVCVDLVRAVSVAMLPFLHAFGILQYWHFIVVAIIIGGLGSLFDPALQASLPLLAGDKQTLQAMNGLMDVTSRLARALGPSLAGLLVVILPLPQFFTLDAISFVVSALAILSLTRHFIKKSVPQKPIQAGIGGIIQDSKKAYQLVWRHTLLSWTIISYGIINLLWSICFILGVPFLVDQTLHGDVGAYGLIVGAYGVGNVISNFVIGSLHLPQRTLMIFGGKIVLGLGFLLMAVSHSLPLAMLGSACAALGGPMGDIPLSTMMQTDLPSNQLGKIYSFRMIVSNIGASLGYLIAKPLFDYAGVGLTIQLGAGAIVLLGCAGLYRFKLRDPLFQLEA